MRSIFSSFRTSQKIAVFAQENWLHNLSMGDTHSEATIVPLEDFDFLQYQFLLTRKVMLVSYCWSRSGCSLFHITNVQFVFHSSITN